MSRLVQRSGFRLLVAFLGLIVIGAILLVSPVSMAPGTQPSGVVNALFTATSAVCVTGLTVVNIGTDLWLFRSAESSNIKQGLSIP